MFDNIEKEIHAYTWTVETGLFYCFLLPVF